MEQALRDKEAELAAMRTRMENLKADFLFNLQLVNDRDAELARFELALEQV